MSGELDEVRRRTALYLTGALRPDEEQALEARLLADPSLGERLGIGAQIARLYRLIEPEEVVAESPTPPWWFDRRVVIWTACALVALALALIWTGWGWRVAADRVELLEARSEHGLLEAASSTQGAVLEAGSGGMAGVSIGEFATRVDLRVLLHAPRFNVFRATLMRSDGVTVFVADRLQRDSNGHLNLSFNSSAVPPGSYDVVIEGVTYRGEHVPLGRARFNLVRG